MSVVDILEWKKLEPNVEFFFFIQEPDSRIIIYNIIETIKNKTFILIMRTLILLS